MTKEEKMMTMKKMIKSLGRDDTEEKDDDNEGEDQINGVR